MSGGSSKPDPYHQRDPPKKKSTKKKTQFSESTKEKMRQKAKERWRNPDYRERMSKAFRNRQYTEEGKKKISNKMKRMWQDDEYRRAVSKGLQKAMENPKQREIRSRKNKAAWKDPVLRGEQSERSQGHWKNQEYREKVSKGVQKAVKKPAWREAHSKALRKRWKNPAYRESQLKALRKGLVDKGLVGSGPTKRRRKLQRELDKIRKRDNHSCIACGKKHNEDDDAYDVHHIIPRSSGGPNEPWNLATLDKSCHRIADAQSGEVKLPLDSDGNPVMEREKVLSDWWNYYYGNPT